MGSSILGWYHWIFANLKSEVQEQNCVRLFCYFNFERNYDVLNTETLCILLNKNMNFNRNETKSKMENPTHSFREKSLVVRLIWESQIKSKTMVSWSSRKKKEDIFSTVHFFRREFFWHLCFISMYSVLNTLSKYTYFHISKKITSYIFDACF